jgi:hypothetical protein
MHGGHKFAPIKRATEVLLARVQQCIADGDYQKAEKLAAEALNNWRAAGAPRQDEGALITTLGKCLEGQRKYEEAYDLYIQSLNNLTGQAYDEVYSSFLYLNERMGTFADKNRTAKTQAESAADPDQKEPHYPQGYYDDFNKGS